MSTKLMRRPSGVVSEQDGPNCWNYTFCAMYVRYICNVLNVPEDESCVDMYEHIREFNVTTAKEKCRTADAYNKLCLYVFLFWFATTSFPCGEKIYKVVRAFNKFIFSGENEEAIINQISSELSESGNPVVEAAMTMINAFRVRAKMQGQKPPLLLPTNVPLVNTNDFKSMIDTIKDNLNNGLYVGLGINIGHGEYAEKFNSYNKLQPKPVAKYIKNQTQDERGHIMVITSYSGISRSKEIILHVRNSWGKGWGNDGYIDIFSSELPVLDADVVFLIVINKKNLTQKTVKHSVKSVKYEIEEIDEEIDEEERALEEKLLEAFEKTNANDPITKDEFDEALLNGLLPYENQSIPDEIFEFIQEKNNTDDDTEEPITVRQIVIASRFREENDSFDMMLPSINIKKLGGGGRRKAKKTRKTRTKKTGTRRRR
jgi:hypothetical protein